MCNQLFAVHSCNHMEELKTTQCSIWENTSSMCAKLQTSSQPVSTRCYQCIITDEASHIDLAELDHRARGLLSGLLEQIGDGKERSRFGQRVSREAVEQLGRYVDVYSCKVQAADRKAREERRKRLSERSKRRTSELEMESRDNKEDGKSQGKDHDGGGSVPDMKTRVNHEPERGRLRELETKINSVTQFWGEQVRNHEGQMEAAGRSHAVWRLSAIMSRLDAAHRIWNQRIKEVFEDAKSALK